MWTYLVVLQCNLILIKLLLAGVNHVPTILKNYDECVCYTLVFFTQDLYQIVCCVEEMSHAVQMEIVSVLRRELVSDEQLKYFFERMKYLFYN